MMSQGTGSGKHACIAFDRIERKGRNLLVLIQVDEVAYPTVRTSTYGTVGS